MTDSIMDFIEKSSYIIADGAMGTYFAKLSGKSIDRCELANIESPGVIRRIHDEYIDAGAMLIRTNTFAANTVSLKTDLDTVLDIVRRGFEIASSASIARGANVHVLADIGPIEEIEDHDWYSEYKAIVDAFLDSGAKNFILETFGSVEKLIQVCRYIKQRNSEIFILAQFAVTPEGFTRKGIRGEEIINALAFSNTIDAFGFNCLSGPMHLLKYMKGLIVSGKISPECGNSSSGGSFGSNSGSNSGSSYSSNSSSNSSSSFSSSFSSSANSNSCGCSNNGIILSAMPNAGYPVTENERTVYIDNPEYFASIMSDFKDIGVKILGGCCGTTPHHIRKMAEALGKRNKIYYIRAAGDNKITFPIIAKNNFKGKLMSGKPVIAVELDSPSGSHTAHLENFIEGAKAIKDCGADIITIADCPLARARMDSSILAAKVKREACIDVLPHMTCRDRNVNAIKALLLGLHAEGVRNILAVTGDPIPEAERNQVKGVFNFNSYMLIEFIKNIGKNEFAEDEFFIGGALNVNSVNFDAELKRAKIKIQKGAKYFLTQPVFDSKAVNALKEAKNSLDAKILGGILPVVSYRNALFLKNEIPGISMPESIINQFEGKGREEAEIAGIDIAVEMCGKIIPYVDGIYLVTPFNKWQMICKIITRLHQDYY